MEMMQMMKIISKKRRTQPVIKMKRGLYTGILKKRFPQ